MQPSQQYIQNKILTLTHHFTHTQVTVYWRFGWWWHTPIPMPTLDCLHRHIFLLHVYRSISLARMRSYMQLAYLFHQCAKSFLSGDSRIADCTVRHPGVERQFSSLYTFVYFVGIVERQLQCFTACLLRRSHSNVILVVMLFVIIQKFFSIRYAWVGRYRLPHAAYCVNFYSIFLYLGYSQSLEGIQRAYML